MSSSTRQVQCTRIAEERICCLIYKFALNEKNVLNFLLNEEYCLEPFDRKILSELQAAPSLTVAELAARVGLSQTPCWRRLKALEDAGVIRERAVLLDPRKLGLLVDVFAYIKIGVHDEATLEAFEHEVRSLPAIVECFSMAGDSDYILRIVTRSIEDYEHFLKKTLLHLPGVTSVNSSFALKPIKVTTALPL